MSLLHHNLLISREDKVSLCGICNRLQNMKIEILKKYYENVMRISRACCIIICKLVVKINLIKRVCVEYATGCRIENCVRLQEILNEHFMLRVRNIER